jgi:hypothetical protein
MVLGLVLPVISQGQEEKPRNTNKPINSKEADTELYLEGTSIIAKFEGKNPHVKFFMTEYNESEKVFYKIIFKSLNELDASGRQVEPSTHSFNGLESQSFQTNVISEEHEYGQMIKASFSTIIEIDSTSVDVIFHFYIFGYDTTTTITGTQQTTTTGQSETVSVTAATEVKFDVEIHNWPFLSESNLLELDVRLISIHKIKSTSIDNNESKQVTTTTDIESTEGGKPKGDEEKSYMVLPSTAIADGEEVQVQVDYKRQGNLDHIYLTFPYFNSDLYYDPVLGIGFATSEPNLLLYGVFIGIVVIIALVVINRVKK